MESLPNVPTPEPPSKPGFWKYILYTFLGTTISILLTFGTSQLFSLKRQVKERELTAMMVMGNVEKFASTLDMLSRELTWRDSVITLILAIPEDSLDSPRYADQVLSVRYIAACPVINYDKTTEQIFSNSIETWKNMGNFEFIDNVGRCFAAMAFIADDYMQFANGIVDILNRVAENPDEYPGTSNLSKALRCVEFRDKMTDLHSRANYCRYMAAIVRRFNAINMQLMGVSEQEVKQFISEHNSDINIDEPVPLQADYATPALIADSLPDFETLMSRH